MEVEPEQSLFQSCGCGCEMETCYPPHMAQAQPPARGTFCTQDKLGS